MSDAERLGEERRLIFQNVANGVPMESIMAAFKRSEAEVLADTWFVYKKIMEYRFRRLGEGSPYARHMVACTTIADIQAHRIDLFETLRKLGPLYLSTALIISRIGIDVVDSPEAVREVRHRMRKGR